VTGFHGITIIKIAETKMYDLQSWNMAQNAYFRTKYILLIYCLDINIKIFSF
jgi:hypothetical protein